MYIYIYMMIFYIFHLFDNINAIPLFRPPLVPSSSATALRGATLLGAAPLEAARLHGDQGSKDSRPEHLGCPCAGNICNQFYDITIY